MRLIFKSSTQTKKALLKRALKKGLDFLRTKYDFNLKGVTIRFEDAITDSQITHEKPRYIYISTTPVLVLYSLKRCKLTTPGNGLDVGRELAVICAVIHEVTHHIQLTEKRLLTEVECTNNEIEYLYRNARSVYKQLVKVR